MTIQNLVSKDTKMADVIHMNHLLIPVINRFGIDLGFGDKTVEQVCREYGINRLFFLDIINTYHDEQYFPKEKMREYPVDLIIDYLLKSHEYYFNKMLPETEEMIDELITSGRQNSENLKLIGEFYKKYKDELQNHLKNEEERFFPYIKDLSEHPGNGQDLEAIRNRYHFSYDAHSEEHENVIAKLVDLKNLIIKYLPPDYNQAQCNNLLFWLFIFEEDLRDHERLEDIILLPSLQKIEAQFRLHK